MRRWIIRWISALAILAALVTSARSQPASTSPAPEVPAPQGGVPDYTRPRFEMVETPAPLPSPLDAAAHETEVGVPQPTSSPATYKIVLGPRHACVIPSTEKFAGSEGGTIDVQLPGPETMAVLLSGAAVSTAYLGCRSVASETFEFSQEFTISCSDPSIRSVVLTLDSTLVGFLRAKHKAGARVRLATASVMPVGWPYGPLALAHEPQEIAGTGGRLCNQHLAPIQGPPMPLGHYLLNARFEIAATASGLCDGHSAADFSPDAILPEPFVRLRDPFQGASKKNFGLTLTLTASAPPAPGSYPQVGLRHPDRPRPLASAPRTLGAIRTRASVLRPAALPSVLGVPRQGPLD